MNLYDLFKLICSLMRNLPPYTKYYCKFAMATLLATTSAYKSGVKKSL